VLEAVKYIGIIAFAKNLLEGFGYIIAARWRTGWVRGSRWPCRPCRWRSASRSCLRRANPWAIVFAALLMTNWEPLSVPATFDVVGSEVPKNRRTIAFAVQSIQKRVPKVIGPALGGFVLAAIGYWLNLALAFGLVGLAVVLQLALTSRMRPKARSAHVPLRKILRDMPRDLQQLLSAEIFIRWGDWFARDFAVLYIVNLLTTSWGWTERSATETSGMLLAIMAITALATYIPIAKWVDRAPSPRPFIGTTFFLFAIFPICLVLLPRACDWLGLPVTIGLVLTFVINGLRELGEPARKALISTGFPPEIRARRSVSTGACARSRSVPPARRRLALDADRPRRDVSHRR
jgi:hypothetical protein